MDTGADEVRVKSGDTLTKIASKVKPPNATIEQTLAALYLKNPHAFAGNIDRLRADVTLKLPGASEVASLDPAAVRDVVLGQSANFASYQARLAAAAKELPEKKPGQAASGTVSGKVEDRAAAGGQDQLKLSKSGTTAEGAGGKGAAAVGAGSSAEQATARDAAIKESQSRIKDLEKNLVDLQKLLELKNRQLAELQKQVEGGKGAAGAKSEPAAKAAVPAQTEAKAETKGESAPAPTAAKSDAEAPPAAPPAAPAAVPPQAAKAAPAPAPAPAAASEDFLDQLISNPFALPGAGAVLALAAGYGWYAMRRRRREERFEDSLIGTEVASSNSLFASTGGHSVDTGTAFAATTRSFSTESPATEVDPIAEAEVYIAYGREAQAEEILREAMRKQPERQAIRAKLLEILSGRQDVAGFALLAGEMYAMAEGRNEEWPRVAAMGAALDPDNPLYRAQAEPSPDEAGEPPATQTSAQDLDEEIPSQLLSQAEDARAALPDLETPTADAPLDFDLALPETTIEKAGERIASERETPGSGPSELSMAVEGKFDLPDLDLMSTTTREEVAGRAEEEPIDLPALDELNSLSIASSTQPAAEEASQPAAPGTAAGSGEDEIRWQEMGTKLDLAAAYEEIGDKEGARELLEEVLKGGDPSQQARAKGMLERLS